MIDTQTIMARLNLVLYPQLKAILQSHGVKSSSKLMQSIEFQSTDKLTQFLVNDYFEFVSTGRKAGGRKVPIEYIIQFIKDNNLQPRTRSIQSTAFAIAKGIQHGRGSAKQPPTDALYTWMATNGIAPEQQTINEQAFAIQQSIYKNGIKGKNYLDQVMQTMGDLSTTNVADDYTLQVADEITNDLTQKT